MIKAEPENNEPLLEPLTRREREILGLLAQGFSAPEIAQRLVIALSSVKWHIQHLYGKLGVNSKREALTRATALGLLGPAPTAATVPLVSQAGAPAPTPTPPDELPPDEPPFKGLRHFDASDADLFFGREHLVAALVARLRQHPFLAVVGASGSGKSSVVRAGLIPALAQSEPLADGARPPPGSADWPGYLITPTAHPLEALAVNLTRESESVSATATLLDDLAREPRSLRLAAQRTLIQEGGTRLLLVVDQLEEVFTLCRDEAERRAFIDNLLAAADSDGPVVVVLTLRADFYAHCVPYPGLRAAFEQHQAYIGPMDAQELRRAIEAPAAQNGYEWEPGLVDLILRDVGGGEEPGALPLLSHALLETWKRRRGRTLAFAGYREAGGVRGAIAHTAQSVYEAMSPGQKALARRIFLRLTELGEGTRDTRRRAALSELLPSAEQDRPQRQATEMVLRTLADARLITVTANTAEVAHEAVLQEWPALREWLSDNREGLRLHRRLTEAAQAWEHTNRDPGELFRGARLAQTADWAGWSGQPEELTALEREFLDASSEQLAREDAEREAARQRELEAAQALAESQRQRAEAERARAEEQTRAGARLRQRNRIVTAVGLVALALAAVAGFFSVQANRNALQAEQAVQLSLSRQLTLQASSLRDTDSNLALLLSVEALGLADTAEARSALLTGLQTRIRIPVVLGTLASPVNALAVSPDGAILAAGSDQGKIILWDLATREAIGSPLTGHIGAVSDLAFSPDGRLLASLDSPTRIILWDVSTRQPLGNPLTLASATWRLGGNLAFSPSGSTLAASFFVLAASVNVPKDAESGHIRLWDVSTREHITDLSDPRILGTGEFAFSLDGRTLASANNPVSVLSITDEESVVPTLPYVSIWNLETGQPTNIEFVRPNPGNPFSLQVLTFSHDGRRLASADNPGDNVGDVYLWDLITGDVLQRLQGINTVTSVAFSPDDRLLATGANIGNVRVWDLDTMQPSGLPLAKHVLPVTAVAFTPDGRTLASTGEDGTVILWDLVARQALGPPLTGHTDWVNRLVFSPDGRRLASAANNGGIILWDTATNAPVGEPLVGPPSLGGLAFSPDGGLIASGGRGGTLTLLDAETRQPVGPALAGHTGDITGLAFSPDGLTLASASADQSIRLWNVATGQLIGSPLTGHTGGVTAVAFSPDGAWLASGSRDHSILIWDVATGAVVGQPLTGHTNLVTSLAFGPAGATLASGSTDGTIRLWDSASHEQLGQSMLGHVGSVLSVALSPDGAVLASAGGDQTVRLWDVASQRPLGLPFTEHDSAVNSVAFSPDGAVLASGSNDATVLLWDVSLASWQARACAAAGRNLTQAEWDQYVTGQPYHATCDEWPAGE